MSKTSLQSPILKEEFSELRNIERSNLEFFSYVDRTTPLSGILLTELNIATFCPIPAVGF
ncbi:7691_t:CDS:2 [Ambispora gerdemannii]|uniref:7691_t:CDS:1 n=1 Tax=Ambispora gerdemannii TaxID=144530 RepID=A0A9N9CFG6_9GLOM|nr:7691_t:CDS:2 [Ambispora gerdemannii]